MKHEEKQAMSAKKKSVKPSELVQVQGSPAAPAASQATAPGKANNMCDMINKNFAAKSARSKIQKPIDEKP